MTARVEHARDRRPGAAPRTALCGATARGYVVLAMFDSGVDCKRCRAKMKDNPPAPTAMLRPYTERQAAR
jgi:hypothetical protein